MSDDNNEQLLPSFSPDPKVRTSSTGVGTYNFYFRSDGWHWSPDSVTEEQQYKGDTLLIAPSGVVNVTDETGTYNRGNLSQPLSGSGTTSFVMPEQSGQVMDVNLGLANTYYIKNVNSGLYLYAQGADGTTVTQQGYDSSEQNYYRWRFINFGNNVLHIENVGMAMKMYTQGSSQDVHVSRNPSSSANVVWIQYSSSGNSEHLYFRLALDPDYAWDMAGASTQPGGNLIQFRYSGNSNQLWTTSTTAPS